MITADPPPIDHAALLRRAEELVAEGRFGAARSLLAALQKRGAPSAGCALLNARMAQHEGCAQDARAILDSAILETPAHPGLRKWRAQMLSDDGSYGDAVRDAAEAVIADPADAQAKALLGGTLLALGHTQEARACLAEASAAEPANAGYRQGLAAAEEADGDSAAAAATLAAGIQHGPRDRKLYEAAILLAVRRGEAGTAYRLAETARAEGLADDGILALAAAAVDGGPQ